mmetsp:Transcript_29367/g.87841  ORF Transcript_29367/g.87841 Transcript_29367/m.87841 type:complete len:183 (-) Transcript_29367:7-555(-)
MGRKQRLRREKKESAARASEAAAEEAVDSVESRTRDVVAFLRSKGHAAAADAVETKFIVNSTAAAPDPGPTSAASSGHEAALRAFVAAAAATGNNIPIDEAESLYQKFVPWPGLDPDMALKCLTYALPHAPKGNLLGDAKALARAIGDIEDAEGLVVGARCEAAMAVLLDGLNDVAAAKAEA